MVSRGAFVLAMFGAALTVAAPARAQTAEPRGPRLEYTPPPPGCPSEETFRHEVAILLHGVDHFRATAPDVVRVTFAKVPGGYRSSVQYTTASGETWPAEQETAPSCTVLTSITAVTASLGIPDLPPKETPAPPSAPPEPVSKPSDPSPPKGPAPWAQPQIPQANFPRSEPSPPPPPEDMDVAIGLSGFVLMSAGYTANVSPGFQLGAEMRSVKEESDVFRFGLELRGLLPGKVYAREPVDPTMGSFPLEFDISQVSALAVPCVRWRYLLGCGVAEIGAVIFQNEITTDFNLTFRLGPRLGLEVPFAGRFAVRAFGEALFAALNSGFAPVPDDGLNPANVAWDYPVVAGFFGVGLSMKFE